MKNILEGKCLRKSRLAATLNHRLVVGAERNADYRVCHGGIMPQSARSSNPAAGLVAGVADHVWSLDEMSAF